MGTSGIAIYGGLWALAAIGFVVAAVALIVGWGFGKPMLLGVTLFSLVLTALDYNVAYAGVVVNVVILAILWLGPHIASLFSQ